VGRESNEFIETMTKYRARAAGVLGEFLPTMPQLMPPGSSLHIMDTFRLGQTDNGTSVCASVLAGLGMPGLVPAGNGLVPAANSCNPTLTSIALAISVCAGARSRRPPAGASISKRPSAHARPPQPGTAVTGTIGLQS
jgi:choline dehydrogenase-like flavoprotein